MSRPSAHTLDTASRHCLYRLVVRAGCYALCTAFTWSVLTEHSLIGLARILQLTFMVGAVAAVLTARRRGERLYVGALNHWDEGAALYSVSLGAHFLQSLAR